MKLAVTAVAAALTVSLLPAAPAAAVTYGVTFGHRHQFASTGSTPCTLDGKPTATKTTVVTLPPAGGATSRTTNGSGGVWDSILGKTVADLTSTATTRAALTTATGGLSTLSLSTSGVATFNPIAGSVPKCGSAGLAADATVTSEFQVVSPVRTNGWLQLNATVPRQVGTRNSFGYDIRVIRAGGGDRDSTRIAASQISSGSKSSRVFLTAGASLVIRVTSQVRAELRSDYDYGTRNTQGSMSVSAAFTPAGIATTAARGPRAARKQVVLPGAVSCAGTARIKVTKAARLRAKRIAFAVNGRVVKRVKKFKKRPVNHAVRVPTAGPITVRATIFQKKGKKRVKVTRSYTACR